MTNEILNHKIEYRDQLNLDPAITFGTEIEFAKLDLKKLKKYMDAAEINWDLKRDRSISLAFLIWTLGCEI